MTAASRIGWLDCASGVSGDMLLGALSDLGALSGLPELISSLADLGVSVSSSPVSRHGLAAVACQVSAPAAQPARGLAEVLAIVSRVAVSGEVRERAASVFERLASVEAAVHGVDPSDVHFHEVGAVDAIVDVLGGCLGLHTLGLDALVVSPIALGGGTVSAAHGVLPVPTPAALGLLAGTDLAGHGGPVDVELATPTGIAIVAEWATGSGPMPALAVEAIGIGAGGRDLPDRSNVVRLVVGTSIEAAVPGDVGWQVIEANVDDLDPRLWPGVLAALFQAGAADAWLTPILMKKGRPAHTVSALVSPAAAEAVRHALFTETSTIGARSTSVTKRALDRSWVTVDIEGQPVRVKLAHAGTERVNLSPEYDDVVAAATALGRPAKDVLARATAAALTQLP